MATDTPKTKAPKAAAPSQDAPSGIDPGVPFNPENMPPPAPPDPATLKPLEERAVKRALIMASRQAGVVLDEGLRTELTMKDHEAGMIAPGICRYVNSRPKLMLAVATGGDEYLVALVGGALFGWRQFTTRAEKLEQEAAQEAERQVSAPVVHMAPAPSGGDA